LQQVLALNPKRLLIVPGCPTAIVAIQESPFGAKFRQPPARQAFVLGQEGQLVSGCSGVLEREYSRQCPPKSPWSNEARRIFGLREVRLKNQQPLGHLR